MSHKIALQMDAFPRLNLKKDNTLYLAKAALARGCELFHYEPSDLSLIIDHPRIKLMANGHMLQYRESEDPPWKLGAKRVLDLFNVDVVLIRQDPPFDMAYITASYLLDHLKDKVRVVNDPSGIRNSPEKLLLTHCSDLIPPSLITRDLPQIEAFLKNYSRAVLKPLYSYGGRGVFQLHPKDKNLPSLIETALDSSPLPFIVQEYIPHEETGDKRIIMLDGEPVGAFRRLPSGGDFRGNMRVGSRPEAYELSKRDQQICERVGPLLRDLGLRLAGLDILGDYLTEINVTSPTGISVADELMGKKGNETIAKRFWHAVLN